MIINFSMGSLDCQDKGGHTTLLNGAHLLCGACSLLATFPAFQCVYLVQIAYTHNQTVHLVQIADMHDLLVAPLHRLAGDSQ